MKISVITVVFNGEKTIGDCLGSVASQTYRDVEHIVIDGGSSDRTMDVVAGHRQHLAAVISEPDNGIYSAMNKGLALATGDVVGFLNADDVYASDNVLSEIAAAFADDEVDACYGDLLYVDQHDLTRVLRYWTSRKFIPGLFAKGWMPAHPTFYVRRACYQIHGGYDESLRLQSDFELTMRFLEIKRIRSLYIPHIWIRMRMGGATNRSVRNVLRGNLEACQACRKNGLKIWGPWFIIRKLLSRLPQFLRKPTLREAAQ